MKRILLLVLMVIAFITPSTFAADGNVYENQQYKFRITLPDNWQLENNKTFFLYAISTSNPCHLGLMVPFTIQNEEIKQNYENNIVDPFMKQSLKSHPNYSIKEKSHITIANHDAIRVIVDENKTHYSNHYFFFNGENFFYIVIVGLSDYFDEDQKTINQVLSTFTFVE